MPNETLLMEKEMLFPVLWFHNKERNKEKKTSE